ncbi:MAG: c-type cytochrome [Betaproteobacteria bacterium]|nr:c-type cytochrome [Betaproteobacteria bacterium]
MTHEVGVENMSNHASSAGRFWLGILVLGVSLVWATPLVAQPSSLSVHERGKVLYERHCAVCHGPDGRADTPVGRLLKPGPRNFADPIEMARLTVDRIYRSIKEGKPGTAMAAWKEVLAETEIGDVIDYIHSLSAPGKKAPLSSERLSLEVGRRIFQKECAYCHGVDGRADSEIAKILNPPPRDFSDPVAMARVDDGRMYLAIYRGRPGTAMGGRGELLAPAEIIDVMRYVRSLVRPLPAGMTAAQLDVRVGDQIYHQHCIACHGDAGDGRTSLGQHLVPPPRDFTKSGEMASINDNELTQAIMHGRAGTAMAPWGGVLNKDDVRRVIRFIRQSFSRAR